MLEVVFEIEIYNTGIPFKISKTKIKTVVLIRVDQR